MKGPPPTPSIHVLVAALALALSAPGAAAQEPTDRVPTPDTVSRLVAGSDEAHARSDVTGALDLLERALSAAPEDYEALWRSAREAVTLGMLASSDDEARGWYRKAVGYARDARRANAEGVEGSEWLAIALGREALHEGPRSRVRMAVEIRDVALETLARDSTNAGAHHVLGEWNAQIRRLSGIERWMAKTLLGGGVFDEASWDEAERHLSLAVRYDPTGLVHYLDLARVVRDRGRREEASRIVEELLQMPSVAPTDPRTKEEAEELLRNLGG